MLRAIASICNARSSVGRGGLGTNVFERTAAKMGRGTVCVG